METVLRVLLIYGLLFLALRLMGKREFGQLSPLEFLVLLIIPEMVSSSLNQEDRSLTNGIIGASTLLGLVFLTSMVSHWSRRAERLIADSEAVLVHRGQIFEDVLNRERITPCEIMTEARKSGVESMDRIKWAVLEADGRISVIPEKGEGEGGGQHERPGTR